MCRNLSDNAIEGTLPLEWSALLKLRKMWEDPPQKITIPVLIPWQGPFFEQSDWSCPGLGESDSAGRHVSHIYARWKPLIFQKSLWQPAWGPSARVGWSQGNQIYVSSVVYRRLLIFFSKMSYNLITALPTWDALVNLVDMWVWRAVTLISFSAAICPSTRLQLFQLGMP